MRLVEVYENLCNYDPRKPYGYISFVDKKDLKKPRQDCHCDNCHYGRDKLAREILKLTKKSRSRSKELKDACRI